jgi:5-methyltetrahydrofolate--homocysteine methyltransferase
MPDVALRLGRDMLVLEGAMGTMLQQAGVQSDSAPELLNIVEPDQITQIHYWYHTAGADCAITNTFGGSRPKLAQHGIEDLLFDVNAAAVRLARAGGAPHVLADIGPTGLVIDPLGPATFDEVYDAFFEQATVLASETPDAFLLETFTDIAEARAAALACRAAAPDIPVIALVTFGQAGRMELSGTDPATAAVILEAAGASAVGMNCGLGPEQMDPLTRAMIAATRLPVVVQPNAGLPTMDAAGHTHFPGTPADFSAFARDMYAAGVAAIGSCCGSTPTFTGAIADEIADRECVPVPGRGLPGTVIASPQRHLSIGGSDNSGEPCTERRTHPNSTATDRVSSAPSAGLARTLAQTPLRAIGERINPTGKPALKEALLAGSMQVVRELASQEQRAGADLLDVNVGAAGVDEAVTLPLAVKAVAGSFPLPVSIDTTNAAALEASLKLYPGKALVNSVTGESHSLEAVLPLVARYGAAVVVLALDDDGIPATAEGRLAVVRKVQAAAHKLGIPDKDLLVDSLVMAAAADPGAPQVTLDTLSRVREELGLSTLLGVSNVSHGLPNRAVLNAAFLSAGAARGLDAAIINPNDTVIAEALATINAAREAGEASHSRHSGKTSESTSTATDPHPHCHPERSVAQSKDLSRPIANDPLYAFNSLLEAALKPAAPQGAAGADSADLAATDTRTLGQRLTAAIQFGDSDGAPKLVDALAEKDLKPAEIIQDILTPAIQELGEGFATGDVFLPQLMVAADAMKAATARAKSYLPAADAAAQIRGRVVFATVKGDIHSIGKDICISLLESQSIEVNDLGVDVAPEAIIAAAREADVVCLSALMTTTLPAMEATTIALRELDPHLPVALGGAVVTRDWATSVGALYTKDAPALVTLITQVLDERK